MRRCLTLVLKIQFEMFSGKISTVTELSTRNMLEVVVDCGGSLVLFIFETVIKTEWRTF